MLKSRLYVLILIFYDKDDDEAIRDKSGAMMNTHILSNVNFAWNDQSTHILFKYQNECDLIECAARHRTLSINKQTHTERTHSQRAHLWAFRLARSFRLRVTFFVVVAVVVAVFFWVFDITLGTTFQKKYGWDFAHKRDIFHTITSNAIGIQQNNNLSFLMFSWQNSSENFGCQLICSVFCAGNYA